ncbi:MAG: UDP-N-acetyl-D-mannosaminuronic acid transferase [Patescibacteria group bacterium]|nr:MAG: UDP-N-acetyl-D-mannosaminuronic acid transferase [Patescibacteria group bacterium]
MKQVSILSVPVTVTNYLETITFVKRTISQRKKIYIYVAAVHLIMECQKNPKLLKSLKGAAIVTPDGMPLVWISKLLGNKLAGRVYGPNLTIMLCRLAELSGFTIFLLGGSTGQSKNLVSTLQSKFKKINIVGNIDTPIRPIPKKENQIIVDAINKSKPDIVFVGLGCPNQELWIMENRSKVSAPVLIGVGAAFDFISGKVQQAPVWMQNSGLEWLYRLIQEPKRLWKRYLILNTLFIFKIIKQILKSFFVGQ